MQDVLALGGVSNGHSSTAPSPRPSRPGFQSPIPGFQAQAIVGTEYCAERDVTATARRRPLFIYLLTSDF